MMLALYRSKNSSRKWYHRIIFHIVSQCAAVNARVVYRDIGGQNSYIEFLAKYVLCLLAMPDVTMTPVIVIWK